MGQHGKFKGDQQAFLSMLQVGLGVCVGGGQSTEALSAVQTGLGPTGSACAFGRIDSTRPKAGCRYH